MKAISVHVAQRARRVASAFAVVTLAAAALTVTGFVAAGTASADPGAVAQRSATDVTADALPTVQIDGVVWSQAVVGSTVYAGGSFANARPAGSPAGQNNVPRNNLLAYDIDTGALITAFAPSLNAQAKVVTASPSGSRVYVGGSFTTADGQDRYRIAAYSTATGQLVASFAPVLDATVNAIVATDTTVYVGGAFSMANGVARARLAAFSAADGSLLNWAPTADDNDVEAMVMAPDGSKLIVGGSFTTLNSSPNSYGLGALDATTGTLLAWAAPDTVKDAGTHAAILSLSTDGSAIYGSGYVYGAGGNLEGVFSANPASGSINWIEDCHGDTYSTYAVSSVVYSVSHAHDCTTTGDFPQSDPISYHRALAWTAGATGTLLHNSVPNYADWGGTPSPSLVNWFPDLVPGGYTHQTQAAWNVSGNSKYIVLGGEFPSVNGVAQQGLVRFAVPTSAPKKQGPMLQGAMYTPTLIADSATTVSVSWPANWDRDDQNLTYRLVRNGDIDHPIYTTTDASQFWNLPVQSFIDKGLTPSTTYYYHLRVSDPDGNLVRGDDVGVTTQPVGANLPPTAAFTSSCTDMSCTFDGSGSADSDGSVASYAWDFGDGATGTGAKPSHAYGTAASYSVRLTVTDNQGETNAISHTVTATVARATTAAFSNSCVRLACTFDASASLAAGGTTINTYTWSFGDGAKGTGVKPAHTYAAAGTYQVLLTVTDSKAGTDSASKSVAVTANYIADTFGRTMTGGWGSATTGGPWTVSPTTAFAVSSGQGSVTLSKAGTGATASLLKVNAADLNVLFDSGVTKPSTGNGLSLALQVRHTTNGEYRFVVQYMPNGRVHLVVSRIVTGSSEVVIRDVAVAGLTYTVGSKLRARLQISGIGTTRITGKIWKVGATEPSTPQVSVSDTTAKLQVAGTVGLRAYLSGLATNAPVAALIDNLSAS
jgi:PKD repeat protein